MSIHSVESVPDSLFSHLVVCDFERKAEYMTFRPDYCPFCGGMI